MIEALIFFQINLNDKKKYGLNYVLLWIFVNIPCSYVLRNTTQWFNINIVFRFSKNLLHFSKINFNNKKSFGLNFKSFLDICYHFMHLLYETYIKKYEKYIKKYNDGFVNSFKFNKWQNLIYKDQNYFSNIFRSKEQNEYLSWCIYIHHFNPKIF